MSARQTLSIVLLFAPIAAGAEGVETPGWADVSTIFTERCVMCHSAVAGASKGLRLDNYTAALAGGKKGAVLVPGNIAGSELISRLRGQSTPRMPFLSRPLPEDQIALIERWIEAGLPEVGASR